MTGRDFGILARVRLAPGSAEPLISDWRCVALDALLTELPRTSAIRTCIIAVDGRSASGKTTLAERLHTVIPNSAIVHTDDIAWNYSMFDWADALADNIIRPVSNGEPVNYQPPGWPSHGRSGAIQLPACLDALIVEGVGAGRRQLAPLMDVLMWVQSDFSSAHERGIARDIAVGNRDPEECRQFWDWWMAAELPFLEDDKPWARADLAVAGSPIEGCLDQERIAVNP